MNSIVVGILGITTVLFFVIPFYDEIKEKIYSLSKRGSKIVSDNLNKDENSRKSVLRIPGYYEDLLHKQEKNK